MSEQAPAQSLQPQDGLPASGHSAQAQDLFQTKQQLMLSATNLERTRLELELEKSITAALRKDLAIIMQSRSWKVTRPLRTFARALHLLRSYGPVGFGKRVLQKFVYSPPPLPAALAALPQPGQQHPLEFAAVTAPRVSIIIPVYNKSEYTFHCLKSVLANSTGQSYEVIVIDDGSSDDTQQMLGDISGITVIRNDTNLGFIGSCNRAAQAAHGEFLLMLNNDTEVQAGWLDALLGTFVDKPDAGLVGAKLLFANGTLQEAGGIVWQDGSAWNYGRNDDPNKPEYSYLRAVDYCSGACILFKRADFMALGMFDTLYSPAYYEDTDLAFKIRTLGKQVYYQPNARVIHFEGVTSGTDLNSGVKEYQRINHHKFFERWQHTLQAHRPHGQQPQLERERAVSKRVLIVDPLTPTPDRDSGSLRMMNLLAIFQQLGYKVTFFPDNLRYYEHYTPRMQALGIECCHAPYVSNLESHLKASGALYQVVLLSRADCAEKYIDTVRRLCPQAQVLFDTVDLHFLREQREAELSGSQSGLAAAQQRKVQELSVARKADVTLVVSPVEIDLFKQEAPDVKLALLSNIHQVEGCNAGYAQRCNIMFIGNFMHPPNVDAMHWFIDEVFPLLHRRDSDIKLYVVGGYVPAALLAKANTNIQFTGFVTETAALFNLVRLSIAPLRYGAGVKGKINSSMSFGVPVIATTVAAEGMGLTDAENVLIADAPQDFAEAILRAYNDAGLWQQLSVGGLQNIEECFSFDVARRQLCDILGEPAPLQA